MAKKSLKKSVDDVEARLKALHTDYLSLKRKNTKLVAWIHSHGGDVKEILREVVIEKTGLDIF